MLFDCGEGILTQVPPKATGQRGLDAVCISHLHGDHVYGLPGLLSSMTLAGRTRPLALLGPPALRDFVSAVLGLTSSHGSFELLYPVLPKGPSSGAVLELRDLVIYTLPLIHRVEAYGFCVSSPTPLRRLRADVVERYGIPYDLIADIKAGADLPTDTGAIPNATLTLDPHARQTVAYLTDTSPLDGWPGGWPTPDLLLHDATFAPEDEDLAQQTGHATTLQAAAFAKTINARTLLLTHGSVRYSPEAREAMARAADASLSSGTTGRTSARWASQGEVIELGGR